MHLHGGLGRNITLQEFHLNTLIQGPELWIWILHLKNCLSNNSFSYLNLSFTSRSVWSNCSQTYNCEKSWCQAWDKIFSCSCTHDGVVCPWHCWPMICCHHQTHLYKLCGIFWQPGRKKNHIHINELTVCVTAQWIYSWNSLSRQFT